MFARPVLSATITIPKPGTPVSLTIPDTDLLVTGCVAPGSLVYVRNNNTVVGSVVANSNGVYSRLLAAQTPTIHTISTFFEDKKGVRSTPTSKLVALPEKTLTTLDMNPPPTVVHAPNSVTAGSSVTFQGYACPNATVKVTIDGNVKLTATADASGFWTASINSINFVAGAHSYVVSASGSGYSTINSQANQFTVVAVTPADPVVDNEPDLRIPVTIKAPNDGFRTTTTDVLVSGTGPPNTQIEIYVDGVLAGSVFSNAFGEWSLILGVLGISQTIEARACSGSRCGDISNNVKVFVESTPVESTACNVVLSLEEYRFGRLQIGKGIDLEIQIEGSAKESRYDLVTDWGDTTINHQTSDKNQFKIHHTYKTAGHYNGTVAVVEEKTGCKDTVYFSVYASDRTDDNLLLWLLLAGIVLGISYRYYASSDT